MHVVKRNVKCVLPNHTVLGDEHVLVSNNFTREAVEEQRMGRKAIGSSVVTFSRDFTRIFSIFKEYRSHLGHFEGYLVVGVNQTAYHSAATH